jgi:arylsulfatase A-like enzyme
VFSAGVKQVMPLLPSHNLVLITLDCVRPDFLGCYGCPDVRTPVLDRLASMGVAFEQAVTQAPNTWVAHAGLLTGLYPPLHGLRSPYDRMEPTVPTVASVLAEHGYRCAGFPGNDLVGSRSGFGQGFDLFFEEYDHKGIPDSGDGLVTANTRNPWPDVVKAAGEWLSQQRDPVFLWFHYLDTHHLPELDLPHYYRFSREPWWQFYEGKISYADERCVGSILELLKRHGCFERTLLVIASDHGEELLPGAPPVHNGSLSEAVLRVPLILYVEGLSWKGLRCRQQVRTVDIVPTVLDLLLDQGSSSLSEAPANLSGIGLPLPGLHESDRQVRHGEVAYAENEPAGLFCVRTEEWKYLLTPEGERLVHLPSDPLEQDNAALRHPVTARYLKEELEAIRARRPQGQRTQAAREEEETRRLLRTFGYLE